MCSITANVVKLLNVSQIYLFFNIKMLLHSLNYCPNVLCLIMCTKDRTCMQDLLLHVQISAAPAGSAQVILMKQSFPNGGTEVKVDVTVYY